MTSIDDIERVAVAACRTGSDYLREQFRATNVAGDYGPLDVTAEVDGEAESRVLAMIEDEFPDHRVDSEEVGNDGLESSYRWVVDPLDGTNNFTAGLPTFATIVTVLRDGDPVVAAIAIPAQEDLYVARRDGGVRFNGTQVRAESEIRTDAATVAYVIGHDVKSDPERMVISATLRDALEVQTKRVIPGWAPGVYWGVLSRGLIQGLVAYHPDEIEQHAGELLAQESGVHAHKESDVYVGATNESVLEDLRDLVGPIL
jgi:myo-inositol-1(or 4)-monophosphatase